MAEHAVGSRISLISKSEIRYEGFLHFINAKENTVGLKNVRMFGTEGRRNGQNEVTANNQLYEYIVFRGADIKDLTVFDDQIADPAVISATPAKNDASGNAWQQGRDHRTAPQGGHNQRDNRDNQRDNRDYRDNRDHQGGGGGGGYQGRGQGFSQSRGGGVSTRGGYHNNNNNQAKPSVPQPASHQHQHHGGHQQAPVHHQGGRGRGNAYQDRRPAAPAAPQAPAAAPRQRHEHTGREFAPIVGAAKEFKDDFDFAKAQTDFHELDGRDSVKKAYDKTSSFFDNLSSDVTDRQANRGPQRQALRDQQKKVDGETFGNEFVGAHQSSRYRRGGGRGRGRFQPRN